MFGQNNIEPEEPKFERPQGPQPLGWSANQYAMRYGIIVGFCMALDFMFSAGEGWTKYISYFIEAYLLIQTFRMGVIYKMQEKGGEIGFGEAWKYIFLLFFYGSLIAAAIRIIYLMWINPDFLDTLKDTFLTTFNELVEQGKIAGAENADQQALLDSVIGNLFRPASYSMFFIVFDLMLGAFLGVIYAAFLSSKKIKQF